MQPQTRKQLIQKIHIGKNELKLDDNSYKMWLLELVDKPSCTMMTDSELMIVLQAMQVKGFKVRSKKQGKRPEANNKNLSRQGILSKIEALLAEKKRSWNYAHAICKRAFNKDYLQWCDDQELQKVMQMLAVEAYRWKKRMK